MLSRDRTAWKSFQAGALKIDPAAAPPDVASPLLELAGAAVELTGVSAGDVLAVKRVTAKERRAFRIR